MLSRMRSIPREPDCNDGPERFADIQVEWPLDQFTDRELHEKSILDNLLAHETLDGEEVEDIVRQWM